MDRRISPLDSVDPTLALRCALGAALRGEFGCFREFVALGRRGSKAARELALRKELLMAEMAKA
jgi:hypothetical protein